MKKDFNYLISTLKSSIKTWDYFVNWNKVFSNISDLEIGLNKLNYLLGKQELEKGFKKLYQSNPDIIRCLPVLVAARENILEIYDKEEKTSEFFNFVKDENDADKYYEFIEKSGLSKLFKEDGIKNLVDYVMGVEVGLDSNGRKNRGGTLMESIVGIFVKDFCEKRGFQYLSQANAKKILKQWGYVVAVDKSSRSFDFAIFNPVSKKIKLIETNFYNGGGSKLKSVCGEFRILFNELKIQNIDFVWITDGLGWQTTLKPLEETYNHNEYVYNLQMLEEGVLDKMEW
ncbi:MAG: type II restriction endonuclease [Candidatus Pacebacteria bacterium]|nr:type II restriction endonuclease [Candidatus Paceibacterota bacterium]